MTKTANKKGSNSLLSVNRATFLNADYKLQLMKGYQTR